MIRLTVRFWDRTYTGAASVGGELLTQWPPSPYRLVAALLAGAHRCEAPVRDSARQALEVLVTAQPPVIHVPEYQRFPMPRSFAPPVGDMNPASGEAIQYQQGWMLSRKQAVHEVRIVMADTDVAYDIEVELDSAHLTALEEAASHIWYLGRSTHPAEVILDEVEARPDPPDRTTALRPVGRGGNPVRCWTEATIEQLDHSHASYLGRTPDQPVSMRGRQIGYGSLTPSKTVPGFEILPLADTATGRTAAIRLLQVATEHLADHELTGVQVFPLLRVGDTWSTGECAGIGLLDRSAGSRAAEAAAVIQTLETETFSEFRKPLRALRPDRWTASSTEWISATPAPAHPDRRVAAMVLTESAETLTGARVVDLSLSESPILYGSGAYAEDVQGGLRCWYAHMVFDRSVTGPVLLPSEGQLPGYGLMVPQSD